MSGLPPTATSRPAVRPQQRWASQLLSGAHHGCKIHTSRIWKLVSHLKFTFVPLAISAASSVHTKAASSYFDTNIKVRTCCTLSRAAADGFFKHAPCCPRSSGSPAILSLSLGLCLDPLRPDLHGLQLLHMHCSWREGATKRCNVTRTGQDGLANTQAS